MQPFDEIGLDVDDVLQAVVIGSNALNAMKGARKQRRRVPEKQAKLVRLIGLKGTATFEDLVESFDREWAVVAARREGEPKRLAKREFFRNIADLVARINAALVAGYEHEPTSQIADESGASYVGFLFDHQAFTIGWTKKRNLAELTRVLPRSASGQHVPLRVPRQLAPPPQEEPSGSLETAPEAPRTVEPEPTPKQPANPAKPAPGAAHPRRASDPQEIAVHEDPVTRLWTFDLRGHRIEVERTHGFVKIDGAVYETNAVTGLENIEDLAGEPLDFITRLIRVLEEREALKNGTSRGEP